MNTLPTEEQCLLCHSPLEHIFVDLGACPPSNAFVRPQEAHAAHAHYPLKVFVCTQCLLVQVPPYAKAQDIFTADYAYFSSYSPSWVAHAKHYVHMMAQRFHLNGRSLVVEIGSNDGYLLQHAVHLGIPCLGIDPSVGACAVAEEKGVPTRAAFFTLELAQELCAQGKSADLICGINVFAHVPPIHDFVAAIAQLLKPEGVMTMEFPHLLRLMDEVQFDTIYHEHYFYYSLFCVEALLAKHGLRLFDVEELTTHGGSLRIFVCKQDALHPESARVAALRAEEHRAGLYSLAAYTGFQSKVEGIATALLDFLRTAQKEGKRVVGYGAAAKGNTLINFLGQRADMRALIPSVVDASPHKQGLLLPGSHIPVVGEQYMRDARPDYVLILPWNLKEEISAQLAYIREWGGKFVVAIPQLCVFDQGQ